RLCHPEAERGPGFAGRDHCLLPRKPGALQGAEGGRIRAIAEDLDRQGPEIRVARAGEGDPALTGAFFTVVPAKAGTHCYPGFEHRNMDPGFAGMTVFVATAQPKPPKKL